MSTRRITFLKRFVVGVSTLAVLVCLTCSCAEAAKRPPNIVMFLVDDMGWADLGCYGNKFHETPNVDRLATQGMRFTSAYAACPVCSPTRASIVTGRYPATVNLTDFISGHWRPWAKLVVPRFNFELPHAEITFAESLKRAGYVSGSFGKWHLGGAKHHPGSQGFDEWVITGGGNHFAPKFRVTAKPAYPAKDGEYMADYLTRRAEKFMEDHRDEPFVLYLPHYAVHIPLHADEKLIAKYEKKPKPATGVNNPTYAAMVEHIDNSLGRISQKLDDLKLADNTVLIFFSDNGGLYQRFDKKGPAVCSNAPLRDEKGSLYEGGIREPLIVRWPGVVKPDSECDVPVTSVDFLPTMAELAGIGKTITHRVDGVSLLPLLKQSGTLKRDAIYWHYPHYHHTTPGGAIRAGRYKLIEFFEDGKLELYDLDVDIGEKKDLSKAMPDKAATLQKQLAAWRKSVGAKMPTANPNYDAKRAHLWGSRKDRGF